MMLCEQTVQKYLLVMMGFFSSLSLQAKVEKEPVSFFQYSEPVFSIRGQLEWMDTLQSSHSPRGEQTLGLSFLELGARVGLGKPFYGEVILRPQLPGQIYNAPVQQTFSPAPRPNSSHLLHAYHFGFAPNKDLDIHYGLLSLASMQLAMEPEYGMILSMPESVMGMQGAFQLSSSTQFVGTVFQPIYVDALGKPAGVQSLGGFGADYYRAFENVKMKTSLYYWNELLPESTSVAGHIPAGFSTLQASNLFLNVGADYWSLLFYRRTQYSLGVRYQTQQREQDERSYKDLESQSFRAAMQFWMFSQSGFSVKAKLSKYQSPNQEQTVEKDTYNETLVSLGYFHRWTKNTIFSASISQLQNNARIAGATEDSAGIPIRVGEKQRSINYFRLGLSFVNKGTR